MKFFYHVIIVFLTFFLVIPSIAGQNQVIDSLKSLINNSTEMDSVKLESLKELADEYYELDFDSTIHYYEQCRTLSESIPHYEIGLSTLRSFGYVYSFRKNNYQKALEYFDLAKDLAVTEKDSFGIALALGDMGRIYWKKGQSSKALEHHLQVRKIGEEMQSDNVLLRANLSLGIIHNEEEDNEKALVFYRDALVQADSLDNQVAKGLILNNIGKAYRDEEKFKEALDYFLQSEKVFSKINRAGRLALVNFNIGKNYVLQNQVKDGLDFYKKALDFNSKIDDKEQQTMILTGVSDALFKSKRYTQAIQNANKGITNLKNIETDLYYEDLYKVIADSHEALGNTKAALTAYQSYIKAQETTNKNETSRKIEELNALYLQQQRETEIQKLNLEKERSARQLDQTWFYVRLLFVIMGMLIVIGFLFFTYNRLRELKRLDKMKTKLSDDLHDNIGASLNHIKMLSGRLVRNKDNPANQEQDAKWIKKISDELMFDLYDMVWSLDKSKSTVGDLVERMQDHIDSSLRLEKYPLKTDFTKLDREVMLSMNVKTNVYAVFKESIHNILKHTSSNPIYISLVSKKKNQFELIVRNELSNKKENPPFSSKRGLENMKRRAEEIEGHLDIIEKETTFEIKLNWTI